MNIINIHTSKLIVEVPINPNYPDYTDNGYYYIIYCSTMPL